MLIWCWTLCLCVASTNCLDRKRIFCDNTSATFNKAQEKWVQLNRKQSRIYLKTPTSSYLSQSEDFFLSLPVWDPDWCCFISMFVLLYVLSSRLSLNESVHTKSERKSPTSRQPISFWQSVSRDPVTHVWWKRVFCLVDECERWAGSFSPRCVCKVVLPRPVLQTSCRKVTERLVNDGNHCRDVMNKRVLHSFYHGSQALDSILISIGYIYSNLDVFLQNTI